MKPNHACTFTQIEKQTEPPATRLSPPPSKSPCPNSVSTSIHLHIPLPRENSDTLTQMLWGPSFQAAVPVGPEEAQKRGKESPPHGNSTLKCRQGLTEMA